MIESDETQQETSIRTQWMEHVQGLLSLLYTDADTLYLAHILTLFSKSTFLLV